MAKHPATATTFLVASDRDNDAEGFPRYARPLCSSCAARTLRDIRRGLGVTWNSVRIVEPLKTFAPRGNVPEGATTRDAWPRLLVPHD